MSRTPVTQVRTSHALTIKANGVTVGLINGWNPTQNRTVTAIYEVGQDNSGNIVEQAPGNITGLQVTIARFDTYFTRLEEAFGTPDLTLLTRQSEPFDVIERWGIPSPELVDRNRAEIAAGRDRSEIPSVFTNEERFLYQGCWFTSLGRNLRSDDNRIVNANATLVYTKKVRITGLFAGVANFNVPF